MHTIDPTKVAAVTAVATTIIPATRSIDDTVVGLSQCIASIVRQRATADLGLTVGMNALDTTADALVSALQTRRKTIAARLDLFAVTRELGLDYGDTCPCEDGIDAGASATPRFEAA